MVFQCARDDDGALKIRLLEQRMEATGPAWATRIVVAAASVMETTSTSTFRLSDGSLTCESVVEASFQVPKWVPIPVGVIQEKGEASVVKQVEDDIAKMLINLVATAY